VTDSRDSTEPAPTGEEPSTPAKAKPQKKGSFWRELPILIGIALVLSFLIQTFVARVYLIPSESMEPTLHGCPGCTGDRILVEKIGYRFTEPRAGDVVVFRGPESWSREFVSNRSNNVVIRGLQEAGSMIGVVPPDENDLVKRIIAVGGQTVQCCDAEGSVTVDGRALDEPYVQSDFPFVPGQMDCDTPLRSGRCFGPYEIPEGNLWMMGDNRSNSADSRAHVGDEYNGSVPRDNVIGKARWVILPPTRWQSIPSPEIQAAN
jgi:signal peptidase I